MPGSGIGPVVAQDGVDHPQQLAGGASGDTQIPAFNFCPRPGRRRARHAPAPTPGRAPGPRHGCWPAAAASAGAPADSTSSATSAIRVAGPAVQDGRSPAG